jgi:tellurite resistance protein TerC
MFPLLAQQGPSAGSPWLWVGFFALVATVMALDLGVFHRTSHKVSVKEASIWVTVWVALALFFNLGIAFWRGFEPAGQFLAAYVLELCMSVDNIFVFIIIFSYFSVRPEHQHRVLFWGILGAVIMRLVFIFVGIELAQRFSWVLYIFGGFLVFTGIKLLAHQPEVHPEKNLVIRLAKRLLPVTHDFHGDRFFVRQPVSVLEPAAITSGAAAAPSEPHPTLPAPGPFEKGRFLATPLFLVLLAVEATDVVFAVDSVPAVLAVTQDRFIAYTSNIFAILGLRSMFFLLAGSLDKFHYLRYGLSIVLIFIGAKMLVGQGLHYHLPIWAALLVILVILGGSVLLSLLIPPRAAPLRPDENQGEGGFEE